MVSQLHLLLSNLANIWNNSVFYQPLIHIVLIFILPSSQHFTNILWRSLYYLILHRHRREEMESAGIRFIAVSLYISPSFTISTAILTADRPVCLSFIVCNMYSLLFSIVNSKSYISLKWFSSFSQTFTNWS